MDDQIAVLLDVTSRLESAGLAYMVSGSFASNFYTAPRMTRDIDIVVELSPADVGRFWAAFAGGDYYVAEEAVQEATRRRDMFNIIHYEHVVKVDFIVRKKGEYRELEFSRRRRIDLEGRPLWIVAPEDLVLSKLDWASDSRSEVQLNDVRNLLADVGDLDREYVERWASALGLADLLVEVRE